MMRVKTWLAALALGLVGWTAQAAPFFASKDGNTVWDKATGLVWMRCSLGQAWDGSTCSGSASTLTFDKAQAAARALNEGGGHGGISDWQVPTVRQLVSIRSCSRGFSEKTTDLLDGGILLPERCSTGEREPTVLGYVFPGTTRASHWTSSTYEGYSDYAWVVDFGNGLVNYFGYVRYYPYHVRLVRATQLFDGEAASAFLVNLTDQQEAKEMRERSERDARERQERTEREAREKQERQEREAREKQERLEREAAARKAEAAERVALAAAIRKGPQQLYLLAGQSQRGKSIEINGRSFGTTELYELIVDKFPTSEYAVKATDQLTAMDRVETQSRAVRNAAEAQRQADQNASNRAQCFSQVRSCEANCANVWSRDYRMAQSCVSGCQRTCN